MGGKMKLQRFAELKTFDHVFEPVTDEVLNVDYHMKGKWRETFFKNDRPIILELGCGKGEYTVGLARKYPNNNYIGVDIKGARIWRGAKTALKEGLKNVAFLRTRVEFTGACFAENEVDEIWLTFSDPQPTDKREKNRLSSPRFIDLYRKFLQPEGIVHMKTDNTGLFEYTMEQIEMHQYKCLQSTFDLYGEMINDLDLDTQEILSIRTYYETKFMEKGEKIKYCKFRL
jgi:tRNA (guanine-N7-)-methyltransferase